MASLARSAAFDVVAADYDRSFGRNPIGLVFRHVVQRRLEALFAKGDRVLDLGCGTGEDALALAARGVRVTGIDPSPAMIAQARAKAAERGLGPEACRFETLHAEAVELLGRGYDGAYSNFGALNCGDLAAAGAALARALRPGAGVLVSLLGPWPLPAVVRRALTGLGEPRRGGVPRVGGVPVAVTYPTLAEARRALGPGLVWSSAFALGVLLPGPEHEAWAARFPQTFAALAAAEGVVRRWPLLRGLGDHVVLEGRRA
jgi:SAM-dependent methyltransferase